MTDYDAASQTVAADDGGRISVFDLDDCPMCGGHLSHMAGTTIITSPFGDWRREAVDQAVCLRDGCGFYAERWTEA